MLAATTRVGGAMLVKVLPFAWQVAQPAVMPVWLIVAELNAPVAKLLAAWQVSQDCVVGMWSVDGTFSVGGAMFANDEPVA